MPAEQSHQHDHFTIPSKQPAAETSLGNMNSAQAYIAFGLVDQANYSVKEHPCEYNLPLTDNGRRHCTDAREDATERHTVDMLAKNYASVILPMAYTSMSCAIHNVFPVNQDPLSPFSLRRLGYLSIISSSPSIGNEGLEAHFTDTRLPF